MKSLFALALATLLGPVAAQADNAPIGPDFVGAAPKLHIDRSLVASGAMNRIEPLDVVAFANNEWHLTSAGAAQIDAAARWLGRHPRERIVLEGHTDRTGEALYNDDLATRRIQSVRGRLISRGIASDRIIMLTYGAREATDPDNPNDRRVVLFATPLAPQQVIAMQIEQRDVVVATWTERNSLMTLRPGEKPVARTVVGRR